MTALGLCVGLETPTSDWPAQDSLNELSALAKTAGIDVVDCVPGEVLREQSDVGEEATECAFGFVLDRPCRLTIPPHVLGQPKIYQLDPTLLSRAQKQLREVVPLD